jgi:PhnB protein
MVLREKSGLVPHLILNGAAKAVEFYAAALGAVEVVRMPDHQSDRLKHVALTIEDSLVFLRDESPERDDVTSKRPVTLHLDVPNCDEAVARAVAAGATITVPAKDMSWGDRYARITDPFGQEWSFAEALG